MKKAIESRGQFIYYLYCDVCGMLIRERFNRVDAHCHNCSIDLCEKCIEHEETKEGARQRTVWCNSCWSQMKTKRHINQ